MIKAVLIKLHNICSMCRNTYTAREKYSRKKKVENCTDCLERMFEIKNKELLLKKRSHNCTFLKGLEKHWRQLRKIVGKEGNLSKQ